MKTILPLGLALACLIASGTHASAPPVSRETTVERIELEGIVGQYMPAWKNSLGPLSYLLTPSGSYLLPNAFPTDSAWKKVRLEADKPAEAPVLQNIKILKSAALHADQTVYRLTGIIHGSTDDAPMKGGPYFNLMLPLSAHGGSQSSLSIPMTFDQTEETTDLQKYYNRPIQVEATIRLNRASSAASGAILQCRAFETESHPILTIIGITPLPHQPEAGNLRRPAE